MELTQIHRARLYALTAVACTIWLIQSLIEAYSDGSLLTWPTIVFSLCLLVVIGYTGYCAVKDWSPTERDAPADDDAATDLTTRQPSTPNRNSPGTDRQ